MTIPLYKVPYGIKQDESSEKINRSMDDIYSKIGGVWSFTKNFDYYHFQVTNSIQITSTEWTEVSFYNTEIETPDLSALIINLNMPVSLLNSGRAKTRLDIDGQTIFCGHMEASELNPFTMNGLVQNIKKGKHIIKVFGITNSGGPLYLPSFAIGDIGMTKAPYLFANLWCIGFK